MYIYICPKTGDVLDEIPLTWPMPESPKARSSESQASPKVIAGFPFIRTFLQFRWILTTKHDWTWIVTMLPLFNDIFHSLFGGL